MSDDQYFGTASVKQLGIPTSNSPSQMIPEIVLRPTIGQTWTDPATGQEVMVVPVEATEAISDAYWHQTGESREMRGRTHAYVKRYWSAMLASLRAKDG